MSQTSEEVRYNVYCFDCGNVFEPVVKTPLWWRAKQRANKYIDALGIYGDECGCLPKEVLSKPNPPYRVYGYDDMCTNYDMPFDRFTDAVRKFIELNRGPDVVFIKGVSEAVQDYLHYHTK